MPPGSAGQCRMDSIPLDFEVGGRILVYRILSNSFRSNVAEGHLVCLTTWETARVSPRVSPRALEIPWPPCGSFGSKTSSN